MLSNNIIYHFSSLNWNPITWNLLQSWRFVNSNYAAHSLSDFANYERRLSLTDKIVFFALRRNRTLNSHKFMENAKLFSSQKGNSKFAKTFENFWFSDSLAFRLWNYLVWQKETKKWKFFSKSSFLIKRKNVCDKGKNLGLGEKICQNLEIEILENSVFLNGTV